MRTLLHVAHGAIIGIGAIAVLATLLPSTWRYRRSLNRLRNAGSSDALVRLAEQRALQELNAEPRESSTPHPLLVLAALASVTAAAIHGAVGPEHFREALRLGLFFVLICAAQLFLAAALLRRPTRALVAATTPSGRRPAHDSQARRIAIASILINAGTVTLWILTRTCGLPFDLAEVEPFGVLDTISSAAELVVVGCCSSWLATAGVKASRVERSPRRPAFAAMAGQRQEGV